MSDAIRYWEPRRILYNLVLAAIVLACFIVALPVSKGLITLDSVLVLFLLAVLANVAYCAFIPSTDAPFGNPRSQPTHAPLDAHPPPAIS